jgi:hypothetical protein
MIMKPLVLALLAAFVTWWLVALCEPVPDPLTMILIATPSAVVAFVVLLLALRSRHAVGWSVSRRGWIFAGVVIGVTILGSATPYLLRAMK